MPITKYENQTLTRQNLVIEECWIVNCVLRECTLFYSGGAFHIEGAVAFDKCQWKFSNNAFNTYQLLIHCALIPRPAADALPAPATSLPN